MGQFFADSAIAILFAETFIKASVVLSALWIVSLLIRNSSASIKCGLWTAGLLCLLVLPASSLVVPDWSLHFSTSSKAIPAPGSDGSQEAAEIAIPPNAQRILDVASPVDEAVEVHQPLPTAGTEPESWPFSLSLLLLTCWGMGVFVLSIRRVHDYRFARSLVQRSNAETDQRVLTLFQASIDRLGIQRNVQLLASHEVQTPITLGMRRSVVVLPRSAVEWADEQIESALLHELAHVKRFDFISYAAAHTACILYWMHPFVWMAMRRLQHEQEQACDDHVLGSGVQAVVYAEHLLTVAKRVAAVNGTLAGGACKESAIAMAMAKEHTLKRRIRAILDPDTNRRLCTAGQKALLTLCGAGCLLLLGAFSIGQNMSGYTYLWYEAEAGAKSGAMDVRIDEASSNFRYVVANPENDQDTGTLSIRFEVPTSGEYVIWGRILAPTREANSFFVSIDGSEPLLWDTQGPDREMTAQVWSWDRVRNREDLSVEGGDTRWFYLKAGTHTIEIKGREKGTGIDKILITDNPIYRPRSKGKTNSDVAHQYVWIEPELGAVEAPMERGADGTASDSMFIWTPESNGNPDGKGSVTLSFEVEEADTYVVWGRVLAPTPADNSFFISIDGNDEMLWDIEGPDRNSTAQAWWWDYVRDRAKTEVQGTDSLLFYLEPGMHTLSVRSREAGTRLDRVLVTNDKSFVPEGWGTAPDELQPIYLWMEAEDAEIHPPLVKSQADGASNKGYIEVAGERQSLSTPPPDGHARFYVSVPVDGTYLLWARVLAPSEGDSFWLRVDGKRWIRWNGIRQSQGWHWEEVHDNSYDNRVLSVELQAGSHMLEIAYRESNTKLDGLLLTNDFNYVPTVSLDGSVVQKRELLVSAFRD